MSEYVLFTGPILAGTQFNWALLGTLALQVYIFNISFPHERTWLKALVYTIFALDVVQTAISSHFAYAVLVAHWGDPAILSKLPWSSTAGPIFTGLISAAVQIFFAWRIYTLKRENPVAVAISVVIVLLALTQCLSAIISDALFAVTASLSEIPKLMVGVKLWLIGSALCDILITLTMVVILSQSRLHTPQSRTDTILTQLIYHTVETGAITAFVALVDVALFVRYPRNFLHETPAFMLGKVYSNVLLATLNARTRTREAPTHDIDIDVTELQWRRSATSGDTSRSTSNPEAEVESESQEEGAELGGARKFKAQHLTTSPSRTPVGSTLDDKRNGPDLS